MLSRAAILLGALVVILLPLEGRAALLTEGYKYSVRVEGPLESGGIYNVPLGNEVLGGCLARDCADILVADDAGREVPYSLVAARPQASAERALVITGYTALSDASVVTFKTADGRPVLLSEISFDVEGADFRKLLRLEGSPNGRMWRRLADAMIYDYSSSVPLRRTTVALSMPMQLAYFRVRIEDVPIAGVQSTEEIRLRYKDLAFSVEGGDADKQARVRISEIKALYKPLRAASAYDAVEAASPVATEYETGDTSYTINSAVPFDRVCLVTSQAYYYRRVEVARVDVDAVTGKERGEPLGAGNVYRMPGFGAEEAARCVEVASQGGQRAVRVVVRNAGSPALVVDKVVLGRYPRRLFLVPTAGAGSAVIYVGKASAERKRYDVQGFVSTGIPAEVAVVGQPVQNAGWEPVGAEAKKAALERKVLIGVVGLAVVVMGVWIYMLMRRGKK